MISDHDWKKRWGARYDFRPKLHSAQFNYHFIKSILKSPKYRSWPIQIFYRCRTEAEPETLLLQYAIEQRATFNQVVRALFLVTRKFYCIASAHENAATARKCYYIHFEIAQIQDLVDSNISLMQEQKRKRLYIKIRNRAVHDLKLSCTRALFLVTGKFYSIAQALAKAPQHPASLKCNFLIGWKNDVI